MTSNVHMKCLTDTQTDTQTTKYRTTIREAFTVNNIFFFCIFNLLTWPPVDLYH